MVGTSRVIVVGAGVGGLVAAIALAAAGVEVRVLERAAGLGGKMRQIGVAGLPFDAGPTVLTMRHVFDEIFDEAGASLEARVPLVRAGILARHAWGDGKTLDLFADLERSAEAVGRFAGPADAKGFLAFSAYARRIYDTVEQPFLRAERPTFTSMLRAAGQVGLAALFRIDGHRTLWASLGDFFESPRLRQLFARYATYCGSSPFECPATLNVVAHVEREGVHYVRGGMARLAEALGELAREKGATIRTGAEVREILVGSGGRVRGVELEGGERLEADAVVLNADAAALAAGLFGPRAKRGAPEPGPRSLSALTFARVAEVEGFPLVRHNVFFSDDYEAEFAALFRPGKGAVGEMPALGTAYVCAQDREDELAGEKEPPRPDARRTERLFCLLNAPATGDRRTLSEREIDACDSSTLELLRRAGLSLRNETPPRVTTPSDFERLYPATGGALYGPASHGMRSPFARASSRTKIPGLYLCGGSAHPGAGVPMVALSGRLAARSLLSDLASTARSRPAATPGGTSMS